MEFTGRIMKVLPARSGVSERTGKEWKTQGFVFEYFESPTDRYSDKVYLETFDDNIIDQIQENLPVRIGFGHNAREITTKQGNTMYINEIRIYKFEIQKPATQPQDGGTGAASAAQEQITGNAPLLQQHGTGYINQGGGKDDDLPF